MKVNKLTLNDSQYPELLRNIPDAPKQLFVLGNIELLSKNPKLSVVGSRKVTSYGRQVTTDLVKSVAKYGIPIVSGLAFGVDAIAHQTALQADGHTIAVMPGGLDEIYPSSHHNLAKQILTHDGLLVSEYPVGTPALKYHFVARNRIVSGLSEVLLITEANKRSGTIHTANFALEQGRSVLAVPGNITSPTSEGTNNLIKVGATPVTSASDILEALGLQEENMQTEIMAANSNEAKILTLLQGGITDGTELLSRSIIDIQIYNQTMTMLEITGKIRSLGANHWAIKN